MVFNNKFEEINFLNNSYSVEEIYNSLNPAVKIWYKLNFKEISPPQKFSIVNILKKRNSLISSPTGSGKTLSAFLSVLSTLFDYEFNNELKNQVYCIYISPLKALGNDIEKNLNRPLKEINELLNLSKRNFLELIENNNLSLSQDNLKKNKLCKITKLEIEDFLKFRDKIKKTHIKVAVRTGDTSSYEKNKMLKNPPHILITTPESFSLIMVSKKFKENIKNLEWVVVDEIHALADSKRGVQLSLFLELLNHYTNFTRIGLSATVSPLIDVAKFLVGLDFNDFDEEGDKIVKFRKCDIIDVQFIKKLDLEIVLPVDNFLKSSSEEINLNLYEKLNDLIQNSNMSLIFTNTRAGTEKVLQNLMQRFPQNYNNKNIGAHHGSLSKDKRLKVENNLKNGELKVVVSSTSLELGIDIGQIDQVILLGSSKSVAKALQRIGRAGHNLGDISVGKIIPQNRDDLIECAVLMKNCIDKKLDDIKIIENSLDVLSQSIFGFVVDEEKSFEDIKKIIYKSFCFMNLENKIFGEVLNYLEGTKKSLEERHVYPKILWNKETQIISPRGAMSRVLYLTNSGTIPEQTSIKVKIGSEIIGSLDEGFLEKLKKGDIFILGGKTYSFQHSRGMSIQVKEAPNLMPTIPSWYSEQMSLSFELAKEIGNLRTQIFNIFESFNFKDNFGDLDVEKRVDEEILKFIENYLYCSNNVAKSIYEYFKEQYLISIIPTHNKIFVEIFRDEIKYKKYIVFHCMYGRAVNEILGRVICFLMSKYNRKKSDFFVSDNGFVISMGMNLTMNLEIILNKLKIIDFSKIAKESIEDSEVFRRRFRNCATRSLMILKNYRGVKKNAGRQQIASMFLLKTLRDLDDDFVILKETYREVLEDLMDLKSALEIVDLLKKGMIRVDIKNVMMPSPFSFNLILQGNFNMSKEQSKQEFLNKFYNKILTKIEINRGFK